MERSTATTVSPSRGHRLCEFIIHLLFQVERAAIESTGNEENLLLIDREEAPAATESPGRMAPVTQHSPLLSASDDWKPNNQSQNSTAQPKYLIFPKRRFFRYLVNLLLATLLIAVEAMYYICLTQVSKVEPSVETLLRLEFFTLPILLTFWFAAPMHTALGYFTPNAKLSECPLNLEKLLADDGANFCVNVFLIMACCLVMAEGLVWTSRQYGTRPAPDAYYVLYALLPTIRIIHCIAFLSPLLLTALAMRGITTRLKEIDRELDIDLDIIQQTNYASVHPEHVAMLRRWSETYHRLGQDMSLLSDRFGIRMVCGVALVLVATANIISLVWQSTKTSLTAFQAAMVLIVYATNASVIMIAMSSVCYPVTACTQNIGPKLVVMAVREQGFDPTGNTTRLCQLLSNAFLLAPIEMHVGNLEFLPSVANTVAGLLLGLFLVVLGYNAPA